MTRAITLLLGLLLSGCGSSTPEVTEPAPAPAPPPTETTSAEPPPAPSPPADPWAALDAAGLRSYVAERARARIAEVAPDLDLAALPAWLDDHDQAPALSGRVVERMFDLVIVDIAAGELERAERTVRLIREKAANRNEAFAGNTFLSIIARRRAGDDAQAQQDAVAAILRELPRSRFGSATVVFQVFQNAEQLSARAARTRQQLLSLETASTVLIFEQVFPEMVASRERFLAAIEVVRAEHARQRPARDYRFATVDLTRARDAQPVVIGVWDVGTNPALFSEQLFVNEAEPDNGRDDDGNGQVDDISGIASDGDAPNTALLFEPDAETLERYKPFLRGIMDLRAGMASTEAAQRVLELLGSATSPEALEELEKRLDAIGEWAHGTHVAGIMVAGVPQARLAIFRSAWAGESRTYYQRGPTDAELDAEQANVDAIAEFVNRHHVRVVNASLGFTVDYLEDQLRHEQDRYPTAEAVRARALEVQARREAIWSSIFEACPNTLFVVAAGNSNRDVLEYHDIPAAMERPNVISVGAVDRFGNWATFTNSNAERVRVFDHGVEVDSLVPDGERAPLSGTSMASPNVANLAAKMFSVDPELTPARAAEIIVETGDAIDAPFTGRIANERNALRLVRRERARR